MGSIIFNTNLAAAAATNVTMMLTWIRYGKPDISMTLNGTLGGLVAITAGCDMVSAAGACLIGVISAFILVYGIEFIDQKLKVDDPVGAIGVHGLCGAVGTLLVGVFAVDGGLFYGGGVGMLITQGIGVVSTAAWTCVSMAVVFYIIKAVVGLRVSIDEEMDGLDIREHALISSYADFMPLSPESLNFMRISKAEADEKNGLTPEIPQYKKDLAEGRAPKMTKVEIYANPKKLDALKEALNAIGITGLTVSPVSGCGAQKGKKEFYRGTKMEMTLLPKIRVETVVSKVPVKTVIDAAKSVLYSGAVGDGKIFVYDVENVIRISTGEEGFDALQYDYDKAQEKRQSAATA
jgi:Amt family ammonium transporter